MVSRRMIFIICLWLTFYVCFHGCDWSDTTEPIFILVPPDATEAAIALGSSSPQTVKIGKKDADLRITPGEAELGKTNMLLVQFKDLSGDILSEVTEEVYVSKSGQTDINLQFVRITIPYIRVSLPEGETGIKIKGWNFKPNEEIQIYLGDKEIGETATDDKGYFEYISTVLESFPFRETHIRVIGINSGYEERIPFVVVPRYVFIDVEPEEGVIGSQVTVYGWNFGPNEDIRVDFGDKEVAKPKANEKGYFKVVFTVPEDTLVGKTDIRVVGTESGYDVKSKFDVIIIHDQGTGGSP
jgi:hypothetical protein